MVQPWGRSRHFSAQSLTLRPEPSVPEVDNLRKATPGSRHPGDSRKLFALGPSGQSIEGSPSWAPAVPLSGPWREQVRSKAKLGSGKAERRAVPSDPSRARRGKRRVQFRKGRFLGCGWGAAPLPLSRDEERRPLPKKMARRRKTEVGPRVGGSRPSEALPDPMCRAAGEGPRAGPRGRSRSGCCAPCARGRRRS